MFVFLAPALPTFLTKTDYGRSWFTSRGLRFYLIGLSRFYFFADIALLHRRSIANG